MTEVWRPIKGFDGLYEVSDLGGLRSYHSHTNQFSKPTRLATPKVRKSKGRGKSLYPYVELVQPDGSRKCFSLHQLVAETFLGPRPPGKEVAHKNGDGWDNRVKNLMWATHQENMSHMKLHGTNNGRCPSGEQSPGALLTWVEVRAIRTARAAGESLASIGARFGITGSNVSSIARNKTWRDKESSGGRQTEADTE